MRHLAFVKLVNKMYVLRWVNVSSVWRALVCEYNVQPVSVALQKKKTGILTKILLPNYYLLKEFIGKTLLFIFEEHHPHMTPLTLKEDAFNNFRPNFIWPVVNLVTRACVGMTSSN